MIWMKKFIYHYLRWIYLMVKWPMSQILKLEFYADKQLYCRLKYKEKTPALIKFRIILKAGIVRIAIQNFLGFNVFLTINRVKLVNTCKFLTKITSLQTFYMLKLIQNNLNNSRKPSALTLTICTKLFNDPECRM